MRAFRVLPLLVVTVALAASGCVDGGLEDFSLDEFAEAERAGFEPIEKGSYSGHETRGFRGEVAVDEAEWRSLWTKHTANQEPPPPAPEVDFSAKFVVAVFMGQQRSGGHAIEVVDVPLADGKFHVGYATVRPGKGCMTSQAITFPFDIVAVDRMDAATIDVVFHNAGQNVREC